MSLGTIDTPTLDRHLVIVGMMAAGKTTLGHSVARRLGIPYADSDDAIEATFERPGRDLAASRGVEWLHHLEANILMHQLTATTPTVISAAASTLDSPACVDAMRELAHVCWVDVPMETIMARVRRDDHRRPMNVEELIDRWERRRPIFESLAGLRTDGTEPTDDQVAVVLDALSKIEGVRDEHA